MEKVAQGEVEDEAAPGKEDKAEEGEGEAQAVTQTDVGQEPPPPPEFIADLPNNSSIDL